MQTFYCYFRYTGRIFLGYVLFVAHRNIIRALWETKKGTKIELQKKYMEEFVWGHHLFWLQALLCHYMLLYSSSPLPKWRTCWMAPIKIYNIAMVGILCNVENMKVSCNLILAGWHLQERDIILDFWTFSFSCPGYDLKLIIKS